MAEIITNRITELLLRQSMTQKDLAQTTGITESSISHYVKGDRIPRGVNLKKIARALGTTTDYLLGQDEKTDKERDIKVIKTLIARNTETLSKEEKMALISILFSDN